MYSLKLKSKAMDELFEAILSLQYPRFSWRPSSI